MNDARFTGNLTRDPETRTMSNGKLRTTFSVAVTRPYTNPQGQRDADYIQFTAYDRNAELAQKYLAKGRKVLVVSHVRTGSYEKDGQRVYSTEFVVDKIEFLSSAQRESAQTAPTTPPPEPEQNRRTDYDDELPF